MAAVADAFSSAFRDFVTDGVPASGPNEPAKSEVRAIGPIIEAAVGAIGLANVDLTKDTRAHLNADLAWAADSVALVYADATDANNDLYIKVGASGSGSWTLTGILHGIISGLAASAVAAQVTAQVDPLVAAAGASATAAAGSAGAAATSAGNAATSEANAAASAAAAAAGILPSYTTALKSALGSGSLKCLLDMDGPKTFASGSIINSINTLDDTPLTFSGTRANMYSGTDPKPVYNTRGIYLSSQAGFDIANGLLSKTSGDFAILYACDLNTLTATIGTEVALPGTPSIVEGDMTLVNADRNVTAGMGADVALVLDQQFSAAQLVNGYFRGQGNTQTQQRGDYYLLAIKGATSYIYFRVSHLGQIAVAVYSGAGGEIYSHSLGTVLFGQSKVLIGARRYRGELSFIANGRLLESCDISAQASITDFANVYINGNGRSPNAVQPIAQGLRHYMKGLIVADDVPEQSWCRSHDTVARRFAMPELI